MAADFDTVTPMATAAYLATLGVGTHIPYTDGGYANIANVIADLKYLGIHQVRDGITNGQNGSASLSSYITMAKAGIHFTFLLYGSSNSDLQAQLSLVDQVEQAAPGSVTAIEGTNEINNQPVDYNGVTGLAGALDEQADLYADVNADSNLSGVPVDYFTGYNAGSIAVGPDPVSSGLADNDNQHPYPNYGEAPAFWVSRAQALQNTTNPNEPAVFTETGYTTNQVNADVQAKYSLDLLMDTAQEGISKTYLYDLMDAYAPGSRQGDDGYGLFDYTGAAKPVAIGLHNLSVLMSDPGSTASTFTPSDFSYTISGLPSDGNVMVLEKSNGTVLVVVWAEPQIWNNSTSTEITAPSENVTVSFAKIYGSIEAYNPLVSATGFENANGKSSITVAVTDHPILIAVKYPTGTAAAPPPPTGSNAGSLVLNLSEDAYQGNAEFTVSVDGTQVGGTQTVTALHNAGKSENFTFTGNFTSGSHVVAIDFLNDDYAGTPTTDRNLYVNSITMNGTTVVENAAQNSAGTANYTINVPAAVASAKVTQSVASDKLAASSSTAEDATNTNQTVKLDAGANLVLSSMQFITADGTSGHDSITAGAVNQTLLGGAADMLTGYSGFGDIFRGTSSAMNGDTIARFGGNDVTDLTNLSFSSAKVKYTGDNRQGALTVSSGALTSLIHLASGSALGSFSLSSDGQGGSLIALHA